MSSKSAQTEFSARNHTISLYLANKAGALNRVVLVFSRRGWNIDSLSVSPDADGKLSRCTIVADGDSRTLNLIIGQLKKLIDVVDAREYPMECVVESELALIRVNCLENQRAELAVLMSSLRGHRVDLGPVSATYQVVGTRNELDAIRVELDAQFGVMDMIRTGAVVMERSSSARLPVAEPEVFTPSPQAT